jgi:iron complex transport system substrate-binding protein
LSGILTPSRWIGAAGPIVCASLALLLCLVAHPVAARAAQAAPAETGIRPQRIASLNLASDEILADILPLTRLVAVTALVDEPGTSNAVGRIPKSVARFPKVDVERLIALRPDLVVVSEYTDADVLHALQQSGLRVHRMTGLDSLPGFRQALMDLGNAAGETAAASKLVAAYDARLADIRDRLAAAVRPRVLYWASGFTAGSKTAFDALITCGGGRNAAGLAGLSGITPLGAERAYGLDPDWLFVGSRTTTSKEIRSHPLLSRMRAVRAGHVVEMPTELLVALNHHAARSCEFMARALHPTRFGK